YITRPGANSRCLLRAIVQQNTHLLCAEARSATGCRTCPERSDGTVRAPVGRGLVGRAAHTHRYAGPDIIAESDGAQESCSANSKLLARCQRSGNDGDTGMRARRAVRI